MDGCSRLYRDQGWPGHHRGGHDSRPPCHAQQLLARPRGKRDERSFFFVPLVVSLCACAPRVFIPTSRTVAAVVVVAVAVVVAVVVVVVVVVVAVVVAVAVVV